MPDARCQYRRRPSDDLLCPVQPAPGETMCPRHVFLAKLDETQARAKEVERRLKGQRKPSTGPLPNTREGLLRGGYQYTGNGECAKCGAEMEWWKTPNDRPMPFDPMPQPGSHALCHFASCKFAESFRRRA